MCQVSKLPVMMRVPQAESDAAMQRCSGGRPARKAPGALRFVCRGGFEWKFKAGPLPKDYERNVFGTHPSQAAFALAIRSHDSAHVRQV